MRSDKVFPAVKAVKNRYLLCQLAAQATRKFHRPNARVQDTMNDVLNRFAQSAGPETLVAQKTLAPAERRAA
ncbi:MAG TPA: DNA-directed RNA polymerase subunit omega [Terriglobales bacterium]|nr:DNA-directed RNA polymerase subunit omega [Terriglobales bacterium]